MESRGRTGPPAPTRALGSSPTAWLWSCRRGTVSVGSCPSHASIRHTCWGLQGCTRPGRALPSGSLGNEKVRPAAGTSRARAGQRLLSQDGPEPPCTHKETARQVRQGPADLTAGLGHRQLGTESNTAPSALPSPPGGNSGRRFPEEHGFGADPTGRRRGAEGQASQAEAQGQPGPQMPGGFGQGGIAAPGLSLPDLCPGRVRTLKLNWAIMGYLDPSRGLPSLPGWRRQQHQEAC